MTRKYISAGEEFNTREKHVAAPVLRKEFKIYDFFDIV